MNEENGGQPLKFPTIEDLQYKIDAYFDKCDKTNKPYCVTGICLELDTSRNTLMSYEKCLEIGWLKRLDYDTKVMYVNTIKRAKLRCENYAEQQLLDANSKRSPIGSIFALKQYSWADKIEVVTTNNDVKLTEKQIEDRLKELE